MRATLLVPYTQDSQRANERNRLRSKAVERLAVCPSIRSRSICRSLSQLSHGFETWQYQSAPTQLKGFAGKVLRPQFFATGTALEASVELTLQPEIQTHVALQLVRDLDRISRFPADPFPLRSAESVSGRCGRMVKSQLREGVVCLDHDRVKPSHTTSTTSQKKICRKVQGIRTCR